MQPERRRHRGGGAATRCGCAWIEINGGTDQGREGGVRRNRAASAAPHITAGRRKVVRAQN